MEGYAWKFRVLGLPRLQLQQEPAHGEAEGTQRTETRGIHGQCVAPACGLCTAARRRAGEPPTAEKETDMELSRGGGVRSWTYLGSLLLQSRELRYLVSSLPEGQARPE